MAPIGSALKSSLSSQTAQPDARTCQSDRQIALQEAVIPFIGQTSAIVTVTRLNRSARTAFLLVILSTGMLSLSGCVVAGVSSGGGFFIWPGSIGLLLLILVVVFVMRRR